ADMGYNVGWWNNRAFTTKAAAIYIDPDGGAGWLKGDFTGNYYAGIGPETGMWEMEGNVSTTPVETTEILPANLSDSLKTGMFEPWGMSLSGTLGSAAITSYYIQGDMLGLPGHYWGIWNGGMGGAYSVSGTPGDPIGGITAKMGGSITYDGYNGYMIADLSPDTGLGVTFTGTLSGSFLTERMMGNPVSYPGTGISGDLFGSYNTTDNTWQAAGVGTWSGGALSHVSTIDTGLVMFNHNGISDQNVGSLGGLIGGIASLWTATPAPEGQASLTAIGPYTAGTVSGRHVWGTVIQSQNYAAIPTSYTTYDNGAYWGYMGGIHDSGSLEGRIVAFYIDPSGNAGYLNGSMTGTGYSDINMFEMTGSAYTTQMAALGEVKDAQGVDIPASALSDNYWAITSDRHIINSAGSFYGEEGEVVGAINGACPDGICANDMHQAAINNQGWGIWAIMTGGDVSGTISDNWSWSGDWANAPIVPTWSATSLSGGDMAGSKWSDGKITGTAVGYGASVQAAPVTWVSVGEVIGTYNPDNSFQMVAMGPWIETVKFLGMVNTNQIALNNLNIPCVSVGQADLSGTRETAGDKLHVTMAGVQFFAYSTGVAPKIWATNNIIGTYDVTGLPSPLTLGTMSNPLQNSGTGGAPAELSATFTPRVWDTTNTNNKWMATIGSGTGAVNGTAIQFRGAAAGMLSGGTAGTITSGTAAGVAK
ncbi:MAG: hypothetical protein L7F78_04265, partial [Syntrophales bacterium LBB04]|nr:hypothetical protein [Syntrophales bacterium LBB04]